MKQPKWFLLLMILILGSTDLQACSFTVQTLPAPPTPENLFIATTVPPGATEPSFFPTFTPVPTQVFPTVTPTLIPIRSDTISMLRIFQSFQLNDMVRGLAFTPDGNVLAAVGGNTEDFVIHLADVVSGQSLGQLDGHTGIIWGIAFSPNGSMLASVSSDKTAKIWDWRNKRLIQSLDFPDQVVSVGFSPDGATLAVGGVDVPQNQIRNATIWTYAVNSWQPLLQFPEYMNIGAMAFSPDGKWLIGGGTSRNVEVWRTSGGPAPHVLNHAHQVSKVAISPDSSTVATGTCAATVNEQCTEGSVWLWDLPAGRLKGRLAGFPDMVDNVAFSSDGSLVAASRDGTLRFYAAPDYQASFEIPSPGGISALALSPDGGLVATGGPNGQVQIWKVEYQP